MPNGRPEEKTTPEEPAAIPPESADEQDQDTPRGRGGKAFLEHFRESMEEHTELARLLAESERLCREPRTERVPGELPARLDSDNQPGRQNCPKP